MNLRPVPKEPTDINLTPLIDVVFLLLIFFMVSTTFDRDSELSIELPAAAAEVQKITGSNNKGLVPHDMSNRYLPHRNKSAV